MAVGLGNGEALEGVDVVGVEAGHVDKGAFVGPALDLAGLADKAALEHELDSVDVDLATEIDDDELGGSLYFCYRARWEEKERFESVCGHGKTGGMEEEGECIGVGDLNGFSRLQLRSSSRFLHCRRSRTVCRRGLFPCSKPSSLFRPKKKMVSGKRVKFALED